MESESLNCPVATVIPTNYTPDKYQRYNRSSNGQARKKVHRTNRRTSAYLTKQFVGWDGEGLNEKDDSHSYVLLSSSLGDCVVRREGISTVEAFETFLSAPRQGYIHIGYGLGYDINMILKDLDRESLETLYNDGSVKWNGYRIDWRQGKSLAIRTRERSFLIYDVLPFFQRSFVQACDEYLGDAFEDRERIVAEKQRRHTFSFDDIEGITTYNDAELRNLVRLAGELRKRLDSVDIHIGRWDGPGAIAGALYKRYETKSYLGSTPSGVSEAARYAYAGGRFELIRKGHRNAPVWQYDINSAYPSAIRKLPCLQHAQWRHVQMPGRIATFGVYRIEVTHKLFHSSQPQPLWHRNPNGTVYFSEYPHGWYWSPEAQLALELGGNIIHEGWELIPSCDCEPFEFVEALYNKRAALKKAGDGAHVGLKLGLNSLYGKLAQQIGWEPGPPLKLPPYHCLEWAGYVTSHCRAQLFRASQQAPDDVIAFETDAIFTRVPLDLPVSGRLGEWDMKEYESMTYLKSGMYWATEKGGKEVEKSRGINRDSISRSDVISALASEADYPMVLNAEQTRFVTLGQALHQNFDIWRHWITAPRFISVNLNGKRIDSLAHPHADRNDGLTETQEGFHESTFSSPYHVEWIDGELLDPDGIPVSVLRKMDEDNGWSFDYD